MWYFHARDAYPEPGLVLWVSFGFGVLSIIPAVLTGIPIQMQLRGVTDPAASGFLQAFFVAAIPEELAKLGALLLYSYRKVEFNEPMDGVVYGVAVSLGFASLENILYVAMGGAGTAVFRAVTAVPMHAVAGVLMGYFVGRAKFSPRKRLGLIFVGWLVAALVHGFYDGPLLWGQEMVKNAGREVADSTGAGLFGAAFGVLLLAWVVALLLVRKLRKEQEALQPPIMRTVVATAGQVAVAVVGVLVGGLVVACVGVGLFGLLIVAAASPAELASIGQGAPVFGIVGLAAGGIGARMFVVSIRRLNTYSSQARTSK